MINIVIRPGPIMILNAYNQLHIIRRGVAALLHYHPALKGLKANTVAVQSLGTINRFI